MGQFIDAVIMAAPFFLVVLSDGVIEGFPDSVGITLLLGTKTFGIGYYLFADAMPGGQSVGKKLLGIAVVNERNGTACTLIQSFARKLTQPILGPLDWIFIFGRRHQRAGDTLAGTLVVEAKDGASEFPLRPGAMVIRPREPGLPARWSTW